VSVFKSRYYQIFIASIALGLGCTIILLLILMVLFDLKKASDIIFGYLPIFILGFGIVSFPIIRRNLKEK